MLSFPLDPVLRTIEVAPGHRKWWSKNRQYPVQVEVAPNDVIVAGSAYHLTPHQGGFLCSRKKVFLAVGEIYEYGVRRALTPDFYQDLSAIRAALWGKSCPAPLCYEMKNLDLVHPGPCFVTHKESVIRRPLYNLQEGANILCATCHERFV